MVSPVSPVPQDPCIPGFEDQVFQIPWPYYSNVKFLAARTGAGAGPFAYTIAAGTRARAFSYAVGDQMVSAGYVVGDGLATFAETNLTIRNQTTSGEDVKIQGLAIQVLPSLQHDDGVPPGIVRPPDNLLLSELCNSVAISLNLNGDTDTYRLGTLTMIPGAGGLSGSSPDIIARQQAGVPTRDLGYPANGWPVRSNFYPVPEGLVWRHQGNRDSQLNVVFEVVRPIVVLSGGSPENNIAVLGVDVATTYVYPTELFVGLKVQLIGSVFGPRSAHQ